MNKIVVITGAMSGVGLALKQKYEKQGDVVICLDLSAETDNEKNFKCNVADEEQVKSIFQTIGQKYSQIDILINCAGYAVFGATELVESSRVKNMFDVNYFGTLYTCQNALPLMKDGSRIINISSACAIFALPYRTHYCASKAGVSMLTYGLRMELKDTKIKVTCICPGDIKTNFSKHRDKTYATNERYGDKVQKSAEQIDTREHKRMSLDYASKKIFNVCEKKNPKPMYIIGRSYKLLNFLNKIMPVSIILKFIQKHF
ncbi:MAG: SDR family NAD(P)-dependent oxidoreductase [Clostridia bacterium]|nr:SDR family NAD(P)-dependent oxidoreductase [Clostridia bacterium]